MKNKEKGFGEWNEDRQADIDLALKHIIKGRLTYGIWVLGSANRKSFGVYEFSYLQ